MESRDSSADDRLATTIAEHAGPLLKGLMGHGGIARKKRYTFFERVFSYFEITRPFLLTMAPPITGAGAILANGRMPHLLLVVLGSAAACAATAGIHTFNDWWDRKRDLDAWPDRPIPTTRVQPALALAYSLILMAISVVVVWFAFNPLSTTILCIALALGIAYTMFLRDVVGYLSLPFIIALFPLGGWAAFSPQTLFTSPVPWVLAVTAIIWQAAHIMVHSPSHPIRTKNGRLITEKKAFLFYPTPAGAAWLGLWFTFVMFVVSVVLFFLVDLGLFYLIIALPIGVVALLSTIALVKDPTDKARSMGAFNIASMYLIFVFGAIIVDVFFRKSLQDYIVGGSSLLSALGRFFLKHLQGTSHLLYVVGVVVSVVVTVFAVLSLSKLLLKTIRHNT